MTQVQMNSLDDGTKTEMWLAAARTMRAPWDAGDVAELAGLEREEGQKIAHQQNRYAGIIVKVNGRRRGQHHGYSWWWSRFYLRCAALDMAIGWKAAPPPLPTVQPTLFDLPLTG